MGYKLDEDERRKKIKLKHESRNYYFYSIFDRN